MPRAGYEIEYFSVTGIDRRNPLRAGAAVLRAAGAVPAARAFLRRIGADVVLAGGGYVAGPVGLAAALTRTPLVLTEADSRLGLANRLLARYARSVCLAFPLEGRDGDKYVVTGRPVPRAVATTDRAGARARLGIDAERAMPARVRWEPRGQDPQPRRGGGVRRAHGPLGRARLRPPRLRRRRASVASLGQPRALPAVRVSRHACGPARGLRSRARARRRLDRGDHRGGQAGGAGAVSARDRRPPGLERPLDGGRGRGGRDARRRAHARPTGPGGRRPARRRATPRAHDRGGAGAGAARRRRAGRRSGARHR